jgi:DNA processing protein
LARNRVIAALSVATLVTEASKDSGSLVTAAHAHSLGRKVFAVPGPITSSQSTGAVHLLKEGALLVSEPKDILEGLKITSFIDNSSPDFSALSVPEQRVMQLLTQEARTLDELSKKSNTPIRELSQIITGLELSGYVSQDRQGRITAA